MIICLCDKWLPQHSKVLRIAAVFRESHSVLLGFFGDKLCIRYYLSMDLDFSRVVIFTELL